MRPTERLDGVGAAPISAGQVDSIPSGELPVTAWENRAGWRNSKNLQAQAGTKGGAARRLREKGQLELA